MWPNGFIQTVCGMCAYNRTKPVISLQIKLQIGVDIHIRYTKEVKDIKYP